MQNNIPQSTRLNQEAALYHAIYANVPAAIFRFVLHPDRTASFDFISAGIYEITNATPEEIMALGQAFEIPVHPDHRESFYASMMQCMHNGQVWYWEGKALKWDQQNVFWLRVVARPQPCPNGDVIWDGVMIDVTESIRIQEAEREAAKQEAIIREQSLMLAELSTPLIPISDGVLVMPLIGAVSDRRAQQVMETILEGIVQHQAETVLLDITGVKTVDTAVANALIQVARAVNLIGAHLVLTGIQPRIAQTLVQLGVSLGNIVTYSTLQAGIASTLAKKPNKLR